MAKDGRNSRVIILRWWFFFFFFFWLSKFNIHITKKKNRSIYIHLGSNAAKILFKFNCGMKLCFHDL